MSAVAKPAQDLGGVAAMGQDGQENEESLEVMETQPLMMTIENFGSPFFARIYGSRVVTL